MGVGYRGKTSMWVAEGRCGRGHRLGAGVRANHTLAWPAVKDSSAPSNHSRLHSALGKFGPMQFEHRWLAAQRNSAA